MVDMRLSWELKCSLCRMVMVSRGTPSDVGDTQLPDLCLYPANPCHTVRCVTMRREQSHPAAHGHCSTLPTQTDAGLPVILPQHDAVSPK